MSTQYKFPSKDEQQFLREVDVHDIKLPDGSKEHGGAAAFEAVFNSHLWDIQTTYGFVLAVRRHPKHHLPPANTGNY